MKVIAMAAVVALGAWYFIDKGIFALVEMESLKHYT